MSEHPQTLVGKLNTLMTSHRQLSNPPIIEFVLGMQFDQLSKLKAAHYGLIWERLGGEWVTAEDAPPIPDQFETFDRPRWEVQRGLGVHFETLMFPSRLQLTNRDQTKMLQLQNTRLHLNWKKTETQKPSFSNFFGQFVDTYHKVSGAINDLKLGEIQPNQWEVTYVDAFPRETFWRTPADWNDILPGLFGNMFSSTLENTVLEHRAAEWSFELKPRFGRLHVQATSGKSPANEDALIVTWTARGPARSFNEIDAGLQRGHDAAVEAFFAAANPKHLQ
jgi:uncharacterized protein (TIGR04255 family)